MFAHQDVLVGPGCFYEALLSLLGHSISPLYSTLSNVM